MLDRLVGRAVLTEPDRVVREHVSDRQTHEGRQSDGGPHVVRENQERPAERADSAVEREAVHDAGHPVLADTEVNHAAIRVVRRQISAAVDVRLVRRPEVGRSTDQIGDTCGDALKHLAGPRPGSVGFVDVLESRNLGVPARRQVSGHHPVELLGQLWVLHPIGLEACAPVGLELTPPIPRGPPRGEPVRVDVEGLL